MADSSNAIATEETAVPRSKETHANIDWASFASETVKSVAYKQDPECSENGIHDDGYT